MPEFKRISATKFRWDNWVGAMYISIFEIWDDDKHCTKKGWKVVGYCDAKSLPIRPDKGKYAILVERTSDGDVLWGDSVGEQCWMHVDYLNQEEYNAYIQADDAVVNEELKKVKE